MTRRQRAAPAAATGGIGKAPHRLYVRDFSDDVRLEIIPISSGYEGWQMMNPFGGPEGRTPLTVAKPSQQAAERANDD